MCFAFANIYFTITFEEKLYLFKNTPSVRYHYHNTEGVIVCPSHNTQPYTAAYQKPASTKTSPTA